MKLHTLSLCAFGPFPGEEHIDFDALSAEGLFLLHGRTGSGKTSVLDAITFALYGDVPGERDRAMLKSHHAPAEREPWVRLEFSRGTQRYRIRRTPAHTRPQVRKNGAWRTINQSASFEIFDGQDFQPVTSGVQAASDEISRVIGLDMSQFTKVILLPQGAFAQFLHANSREKQSLLEKLFDTDRFRQLENYLREEARTAENRLQESAARIDMHAEALRRDASTLLSDYQIRSDVGDLYEVLQEELGAAVAQLTAQGQHDVDAALQQAEQVHDQAVRHAEEISRRRRELLAHRQWTQARDELDQQRPQIRHAKDQLAAHEAATELSKWFGAAQSSRNRWDQATEAARESAAAAQAALHGQPDITDPGVLDEDQISGEALAAAVEELVGLRAKLSDQDAEKLEDQHTHTAAALQRTQQNLKHQQAEAQRLSAEATQLEVAVADARQGIRDLEQADSERRAAAEAAQAAAARRQRVGERDELHTRLVQAAAETVQREAEVAAAEDHYRDVSGGYLGNMAAQLAAELEPGAACLVCGSREHPQPHRSAEQTVTCEQVDAAQEKLQTARQALGAARATERGLQEQVAAIRTELGEYAELSEEAAARQAEAAETERARAETQIQSQHRLREQIADQSNTLHQLRQQLTSAEHQTEQNQAEQKRLQDTLDELSGRLAALRGDYASVGERLRALEQLEDRLEQAQRALTAAEAAAAEHRSAQRAAQQQLEGSRFDHTDQLHAAQLQDAEHDRLGHQVESFTAAEQRLAAQAESEEVTAGAQRSQAGEELPAQEQVEAAERQRQESQHRLEQCRRSQDRLYARTEALASTREALAAALRARDEQAATHQQLTELAATINGSGPDNPLRMTLTSFVLAARLERVAEAATRHLHAMSEGRYQLFHDDDARGRGHQGLDLKVHDEHSDEQRPTSSLSGGETFMASLSMALGLAEVVQAEASGLGMESLFIDEGFGTLDEETLEAVMAALHTLQGEGRRVGVVSHVSEMHRQIPAQLQITKGRSGSTTTVLTPG